MARITVEDCLEKVDNRFELIHLTAKRVRQLRKGAEPLYTCKNTDIVTALREIAADKVIKVEAQEDPETIEAEALPIPETIQKQTTEELSEEEPSDKNQENQESSPEEN